MASMCDRCSIPDKCSEGFCDVYYMNYVTRLILYATVLFILLCVLLS